MVWYIISGIAFALALALLIRTYIRDRRYDRKKVSQAMNPQVFMELEEELAEAREKQDKFRKALAEAQKIAR